MGAQIPGGLQAIEVAGDGLADLIVLDVDATIVVAHSERELASPRSCLTPGLMEALGVSGVHGVEMNRL